MISESLSENIASLSTVVELLKFRALHMPDETAYIFLEDGETEKVRITYGEMDRRAMAIAAHLQDMGVEGERALLLYTQGLDYLMAFWGCLYAKVLAIPLFPPRIKHRNFSRIQNVAVDAGASLALSTARILNITEPAFEGVPELSALRFVATDTIPDERAGLWKSPSLTRETLAYLQYTSGSTADPKGVMVSHGNLLHNLWGLHRMYNICPEDVFVSWLPFFHDMGLIVGTMLPLYGGIPDILMSPGAFVQRPVRWMKAISDFKATHTVGPNFAFDLCVRTISQKQRETLDLSSLKVVIDGAETVRADTIDRFVKSFGPCGFKREAFYPSYGLAEATVYVSGGRTAALPLVKTVDREAFENNRLDWVADGEETGQRVVGCGLTHPDQETTIVHPESLLQCSPDQIGEIWISGKSVPGGYWKRPEETEETFHAFLSDTGKGPFLRTGDLGFIHEGELFISGRIKDMVIIRGRNLYPQDIELTVVQCNPALRPDCGAAFSVTIEGEERLVVVQEIEYDRRVGVGELTGNIRKAVFEEFEVQPYAVVLLKPGSILKTSSGKIQRSACRAAYLAKALDVWTTNEVV